MIQTRRRTEADAVVVGGAGLLGQHGVAGLHVLVELGEEELVGPAVALVLERRRVGAVGDQQRPQVDQECARSHGEALGERVVGVGDGGVGRHVDCLPTGADRTFAHSVRTTSRTR